MKQDLRIAALIRFGIAITILNIAGHLYLGFEGSWAQLTTALVTAYSVELLFEWLQAIQQGRKTKFSGGGQKLFYFLLPAHITGMAVSMLLFANQGVMPIVFATTVAILSKLVFRFAVNGKTRHYLNPSNCGITAALLLFPWVGIAPPYQFTENTSGVVDWILPLIFIGIGSFLNTKFTGRIVLILSWFFGFALQAVIRSIFFDASLPASLNPMTGVAFLLFSFYMISDPATTPSRNRNQIFFGLSVAFVYGILMLSHVVFGLFFSLAIVCCIRGIYLQCLQWQRAPSRRVIGIIHLQQPAMTTK